MTSDGALVFADSEVSALRELQAGVVTTLVGQGLFDWGTATATATRPGCSIPSASPRRRMARSTSPIRSTRCCGCGETERSRPSRSAASTSPADSACYRTAGLPLPTPTITASSSSIRPAAKRGRS